MTLEHILLGLMREPASGTDVKRAFDEAIGHFWAAELSQVYPTLNRMERDGLLKSKSEPSERGPPRKVYTVTAAGRKALREWLAQAPNVATERVEWLAQIWFMDETPERALPFFRTLRDELAREVATLEAIEAHWSAGDPAYPEVESDEDFFKQLTLELGLMKGRARLAWVERCIERIEGRDALRRSYDRTKRL